uniref:Uncharacterized protein n=1 Tax=Romanomermis culicivorax TaxID=13658 RepID=A0A915L057_ROMCU
MTTTYTFSTTTTAAAAPTVIITANPAVENRESQYHVCDGCMHVKTAAGLSAALYIFGYFILMVYQLGAAANAGEHNLGRTVYVPPSLTALFFTFAIISAVHLNKAFSRKDAKYMTLVMTFVFCSIFYLLYLSIATLLAYTSEGEWIDYMRVQVESGPRSSQGLPKDNGYIAEQASGSRPAASAADDPLINTTTTMFEMRTTSGATPMMFNFANRDSRQDSSGSAPPPSYEDAMKKK